MDKTNKYLLPIFIFLFVAGILSILQVKLENPLILAERFFTGGGWIEIFVIASYAAFLFNKMSDQRNVQRWRLISWTLFSVVFFLQLFIGIFFSEKFLMSGKLHLPIPTMILAGPIYRGQTSIMTILFLSTIVLTGPAWCSQLCYFGAMDALAGSKRAHHGKIKYKMPIKHTALLIIVLITLLFRFMGISLAASTFAALIFGIAGVFFIIFISRKKGRMMHCILFCPIGTLVNYLKYINPFRLQINMSCTFCSSCSSVCKYDALSLSDLAHKKPGKTCTLCGDCLDACNLNSITYKLFKFKPATSRNIYLFLTISIHAIFLALARI